MAQLTDSSCPIKNADRRLADGLVHLVEMKRQYFDPDGFRRSLNSAVQELRNVTFVLQKAKPGLPSFDPWYAAWQEKMRADPLMRWLIEARNTIVKQGDLEICSTVVVSIVESWFEPPKLHVPVPLFLSTEEIARYLRDAKPDRVSLDVGLLRVERRWVHKDLRECELLETLAHSFDILGQMIFDAHKVLLDELTRRQCEFFAMLERAAGRLPPCMLAQDWDRTVWVNLQDGTLMIPETRTQSVSSSDLEEAARRYPRADEMRHRLTKTSSLKDKAGACFEMAKDILCFDGYHVPSAILGYPDGDMKPVAIPMEDRTEKHWQIRRVAMEIEKTGASSIILINEFWQSQRPDLYTYAVDDPNRKEGLQLIAADCDGQVFVHSVLFSRDAEGRILLEADLPVQSDAPNILRPVLSVWSKGKRG